MSNKSSPYIKRQAQTKLLSNTITIFSVILLLSSFISIAHADKTVLNQNQPMLDNQKIIDNGINGDHNKPDTIQISENAAVIVHHKHVNPQDNTITEKIVVYTSLNQNSINIIKQNSDTKTTMDRIWNFDRIRFTGRSIVSENTLWNQESHTGKLLDLTKTESYIYTPINNEIKNTLTAQSNNISSIDLIAKDIQLNFQLDVKSFFLISNSIDENLLGLVHDAIHVNNPTMFLLLMPLSGYILIRAENGKLQFNKKRVSSFCFIIIIVISAFTTPLLTSENYWGMAFAQESNYTQTNSSLITTMTNSISDITISSLNTSITAPASNVSGILDTPVINSTVHVIHANVTSYEIPTNATSLALRDNLAILDMTASNSTVHVIHANVTSYEIPTNATSLALRDNLAILDMTASNSTVHPIAIMPNITQSWQFNTPLQNSTMVGKTRIENSSDITSLKLIGTGYVVAKNNSMKNLTSLTISTWVKPDYSHGSPIFTIVSKENQFALSINNIIPPARIATFSVFNGIKWQTVNSTTKIGENWTHIAATFNGTTIGIYVNGTLQSTLGITGVPTIAVNGTLTTKTVDQLSSDSDIIMGASLNTLRTTASNQFSGSIENVDLYDSQLSQSMIAKIYGSNPLSGISDISLPSTMPDANLTTSNVTSLVIPLNTTSLNDVSFLNNTSQFNDTTFVTNFTLTHEPIQINQPVIWTQNVTLSNQTDIVAVELPQDAKVIRIDTANNTNSSISTQQLASSIGISNNKDISTANLFKLEFVNNTNSTINTMTRFVDMKNNTITTASLDNIPGSVQNDKPTKLLVVNDTAQKYNIQFETPAPYVVETNQSTPQLYNKTVIVEHNSTLHYTNVQSHSNIPENLVAKGVHFKLFWMINGSKVDVTNDHRFSVQFVDTNNNGLADQMQWIVPKLSAQEFSIEGIIYISNAQHLDSDRNFVRDVYPQVQARDGNWTGNIPVGNYIRVTFGKNLTNTNDITIFAKSNYSNASIEVYQKDSNQIVANFVTISQDGKYKILLTNLNGTQDTFDLKIVGNPIDFDYIVDPSFTATPSDTVPLSDSAKMPQKTVTTSVPLSDKASPSSSTKDTVPLSESASVTANVFHPILVTDTIPLSDSAKMPQKTVTDTIPLSDKTSPSVAITDTISLSESAVKNQGLFKSLSESLSAVDTINTSTTKTKSLSDSISISHTMTTSAAQTKSLSDNVSITDSIAKTFGKTQFLSDSISISASTAKSASQFLADGITLSDSSTPFANLANNQQVVENATTQITVNPSTPQLVVVNNNTSLTNVNVPSTVTSPSINYSAIKRTSGSVISVPIMTSLTVTKDTTGSTQPNIKLTIPTNTTISGTSWNAVLALPTVESSSSVSLPITSGEVNTPQTIITIGSSTPLSFDKPVRLLFVGQAGLRTGFFHSTSVTEITSVCTSDSVSGVPSGSNECKINAGADLVVWTKHFTGFATWSSSSSNTGSSSAGIGQAGGGGTGVGAATGVGASSTSNGGGEGPYLKIQNVSYDTCDKQIVRIEIAVDKEVDPMVIIRTSLTGVVNAKLVADQPYAQENINATIKKLVYEATINQKETSFEVLTLGAVGHNVFSVGKTITVTSCSETISFENPVVVLPQVDVQAPQIFDVKYKIANQTAISADTNGFVDSKPVTISAIINSNSTLDQADLRFSTLNSNTTLDVNSMTYDVVSMKVTSLSISGNFYMVTATISPAQLQSPALVYWIHMKNSGQKTSDSQQYILGIKPSYAANNNLDIDIQTNRAEGTTATPIAYVTNNAQGPLFGTVSLLVNGKSIYTSVPKIFETGQTAVKLEWHTPVSHQVESYQVTASAEIYGKSIKTNVHTVNTFPSTKTIAISNNDSIGIITSGNTTIAYPSVLYSSFTNDHSMRYKVTSPDGICVIGIDDNCMVHDSTLKSQAGLQTIPLGGQVYRIRYSGPDSTLERFSITSVDPITGNWKVDIVSQHGMTPMMDAESSTFLKVQYRPVTDQFITEK